MSIERILQRRDVWRGHQPHPVSAATHLATGYSALDAVLPGGGWPLGSLIEILVARPGCGEVQLLLPALAHLTQAQRWLICIKPPYLPYAPALASAKVDLRHFLLLQPPNERDALWSMEQALRSGSCGAALYWQAAATAHNRSKPSSQRNAASGKTSLPRTDETDLNITRLRRLQLAAESSAALAVVFRPLGASHATSPAALRIQLSSAATALVVQVIKCRGGWIRQPIRLATGDVVA